MTAAKTRRRKAKDSDDVLPTTVGDRKSGNGKGKKSQRRKLYRRVVLAGCMTGLCVVIGLIITYGRGGQPDKPDKTDARWRKLQNRADRRRKNHKNNPTLSTNNDDGENDDDDDNIPAMAKKAHYENSVADPGCYGANIHEISGEKPNPPGICINDPNLMPLSWRAPEDRLPFEDDGSPWTEEEEELAKEAADKGLDELISFFDEVDDDRIRRLGTDAINSIFDYVIGSGNMPVFHQRALNAAIRVLRISSKYFAGPDASGSSRDCESMYNKFKLSGYANRLHQEDPENEGLKKLRDELVTNLNLSIHECDNSLDDIMENDEETWREALQDKERGESDVYSWAMWAIAITECLIIKDLRLPEDAPDFVADVWRYFKNYELPDYERGFEDERGTWVQLAYLATHLQFVPTGYGRHYCYMKDAPHLYHFYRNNFFVAYRRGGHDLVAEFIDMLATYGCTPKNDIQVRHGVRYVLSMYKEAGHSFVKHRERWEDRVLNDYSRIHKPWTGIASVMLQGCFEPELPGSYGHAFRQTLKVVLDDDDGHEEEQ